jgi:aspartyl-tRNA(Asn)/glutamyl-tRNA(Gln) amidotransferase subunit B
MHTAEEAYAYLTSLRATMIYGGISDCDMEKGQLRCDANISIRPIGQTTLGTKVELKNLNSISFVRDGIAHEIKRQIAVIERGHWWGHAVIALVGAVAGAVGVLIFG